MDGGIFGVSFPLSRLLGSSRLQALSALVVQMKVKIWDDQTKNPEDRPEDTKLPKRKALTHPSVRPRVSHRDRRRHLFSSAESLSLFLHYSTPPRCRVRSFLSCFLFRTPKDGGKEGRKEGKEEVKWEG